MNVIFDIGKVLIDFDWEGYVASMFDPETAAAVVEATWGNPDWVELDRGVLTVEEVLRLFIAKAPQYDREIRLAFAKIGGCPKLRDMTIPMIKQLKAQGHRVYFLSNYFEFLIHSAPWVLEFREYMDGGIFSCYEHIVKPMPEIYELLCSRYSLDPADCVFIDDSPKNITGAENVGIRAILYTGQTPDELIAQING
ncbi:MAG: HAD family phosphatase [Ruminococcus sp.]|nr:HAD family phosphatase [Ruminococcus sp.]